MANIHPLAVVSPQAELGHEVTIGPLCVVAEDVYLGDGCRLESRVVIKPGVHLGENNRICEGVVLGGLPQHTTAPEQNGVVRVGSGNTLREAVTIHRALHEGNTTTVGDDNYFMVNAHVGHDCTVGNSTTVINNVMLGGHVTIGDGACLAGGVGVHQFCRIGRLVMVGAMSYIAKDVPPFVTIDPTTRLVAGLNSIGLRRAGFSKEQIARLKAAYRLIYRSGLPWQEMLANLKEDFAEPPVSEFHAFLTGGTRGFVPERRQPAVLKMRGESEEAQPATTGEAAGPRRAAA